MSLFGIGLWLIVAYLGLCYGVGAVLGTWMWISGQGMRGHAARRVLLGGVREGQRSERFRPTRKVRRRVPEPQPLEEPAESREIEPVATPLRLRRAA